MGAAGPAIFFVLLFTASIIVGICVLAYAARCVLVVVQETGLGQDEIVWPEEPYVDWLGHAVQFIELLGIWLAPAALAARLLRNVWLPDDGALRVLLLAGPGLWLFFPIGLMSSLSAQSRWVPFRWTIFVCFLRIAPAALRFYFLTALVLSTAVVSWYYALFGGRGVLLPVAAVVSGAMLLIYARLLGRLAWIIQRLPSKERAPAKAKSEKRPAPAKPLGKKKRKPRVDVQDPWAASEDELSDKQSKRFPWAEQPQKAKPGYEVPSAEDIEGYGFAAEQPAAPRTPSEMPPQSSFAPSPEECEPYAMRDAAEPQPPPRLPQSDLFDEEVRQRLAQRTRVRPTLPPHPFFSGVYTFPLYSACVPNWIALSVAFLIVGGLVHLMMQVGHTLFGW